MVSAYEVNVEDVEPMSRTYQYRKVMKPLLERKRRARINACLDELKDLMVGALQSEGESIAKLEKADVLELTVRHLRKLQQHQSLAIPAQNQSQQKFMSGYTLCAKEVTRFISSSPDIDFQVSQNLLSHLGNRINTFDSPAQATTTTTVPAAPAPTRPITVSVPVPLTPPSSPINLSKHQRNYYSAPVSVIVPNTVTPPASPEPRIQQQQVPELLSPPRPAHQRVPAPASSPVWRPF
ncbi:unnamed protein product [Meganyctiphanes norvegica]|uniref:Uncharacterized protein n=1 Tax=Meganyctiphanes norvegica TaxID=48144 RepID=A0AAV2QM20_MEGNR